MTKKASSLKPPSKINTEAVFKFIIEHSKKHLYFPLASEIQEKFKLLSRTGPHFWLKQLEETGKIKKLSAYHYRINPEFLK